ncbi:uncharacterized protein METZ01_LOCUS339460, partial [marine metagenome]
KKLYFFCNEFLSLIPGFAFLYIISISIK